MLFCVKVAFRKKQSVSAEKKDFIISVLPGPYKVARSDLVVMDDGSYKTFCFPSKEIADNFADRLHKNYSDIFDIIRDY